MAKKPDTSLFGESVSHEQREFARISVALRASIQPLDEARAGRLRSRILGHPTVWVPGNESTLREMAQGGTGHEAVLAQSILEIVTQIAALQARSDRDAPVRPAHLTQISGGGGQLQSDLPLDVGDAIELRLDSDDEDVPPITSLCRIVHRQTDGRVGFTFETIHQRDQDLLMRLIYRIQRRMMRQASFEDT